jgi:hypothetical protein
MCYRSKYAAKVLSEFVQCSLILRKLFLQEQGVRRGSADKDHAHEVRKAEEQLEYILLAFQARENNIRVFTSN